MPTVQLVEDPKVRASCRPVTVLQPEVSKVYFAERKEKAEYETKTEVIKHKTTSGQGLSHIAKQHKVKQSALKRAPGKTGGLGLGEIVEVTKTTKKKTGNKVTFEKIPDANMGGEVFIIVETQHLRDEKVKVEIYQGVEDVLVKKDEKVKVQKDDKDTDLIVAKIGDYCESEEITNKDDFQDWGIMKIKLEPSKDKDKEDWKKGLDCAGTNKALLYLLVDVHSEHSMANFKSKFLDYKGYKGYQGEGDDSNILNHFLNEEGSWFEVNKSPDVTIRLTRKWETTVSTIGEFTIDDSDVTGYILEEKGPDTTKSGQEQRVPIGTYNLEWHSGTKFKKALKLYNDEVSKERAILIHGGNTAADTEGCLLPGKTRSKDFVGSSQVKLKEIFKVIEDKYEDNDIEGAKIIITEDYEE